MADYRFLTTWVLDAPLDPVWETIHDVARWPEWWLGVESVEELGDDTYRHVWRSVVPYPVLHCLGLRPDDRHTSMTLGGRVAAIP